MVPVGGAVLCTFGTSKSVPESPFLDDLSQTYPGRACMAPIFDLFVTLLKMGVNGWQALLAEREVRGMKIINDGVYCIIVSYVSNCH